MPVFVIQSLPTIVYIIIKSYERKQVKYMSESTMYARVNNLFDDIKEWGAAGEATLGAGEVAVYNIPYSGLAVKVGDGETALKDLPYLYEYSFKYGYNINEILVIPEGVTKIYSSKANPDETDFCTDNVPQDKSKYKCVVIPESVTTIKQTAFSGFTSLISIEIPSTVTKIEMNAFQDCISLTDVTIPDNVTIMEQNILYRCNSIQRLSIPKLETNTDNVLKTNLGDLFGVNNATVPPSLKTVVITGGESIGNSAFSSCSNLTSIKIPNSVTSIGSFAFENCTSLTSVTIPNSVTSIGDSAFSGCTRLTSVTIGNRVTSIGWEVFSGCTSLTSITIPDSVTSIGSYAFESCTSLTSVIIPEGVTSIGFSAFRYCDSLMSITIPFVGASKEASGYERHFGYIFGIKTTSSNSSDSYHIYDKSYNSSSPYITFDIPTSLKTVVITGGTSIGGSAFNGCTGLNSITIPDGVTSIGTSAFYNCTSLTSITIPDSVTSISEHAFSGCENVVRVYISDLTRWCDITFSAESGSPLSGKTGTELFLNGAAVTTLTIPENVTEVKNYCFVNCCSIEELTIPNNVTKIGANSFSNCKRLKKLTIETGTSSLYLVDNAFKNCIELEQVRLYRSIRSNSGVFSGCTSMKGLYVTSLDSLLSSNFVLQTSHPANASNNCYLYIDNTSANYLEVETSKSTISSYMFYNIKNIKNVKFNFPLNYSCTLGDSSFENCSNLETIYFSDNNLDIKNTTFKNCSSLKHVSMTWKTANSYRTTWFENSKCYKISVTLRGQAHEYNGVYCEQIHTDMYSSISWEEFLSIEATTNVEGTAGSVVTDCYAALHNTLFKSGGQFIVSINFTVGNTVYDSTPTLVSFPSKSNQSVLTFPINIIKLKSINQQISANDFEFVGEFVLIIDWCTNKIKASPGARLLKLKRSTNLVTGTTAAEIGGFLDYTDITFKAKKIVNIQ